MKFIVASAFLKAGMTLGTQANEGEVRALIARMRPVRTQFPLIRIGGNGDGGYLVPDDLYGLQGCFSPGVAQTATFEKEMIDRGVPCFLADASVESAPISGPLVRFDKKYLGVVDDESTMTIDRWLELYTPDGNKDLLLQMDIEGWEWPVLLNASSESLRRFRVIVIELHDLDKLLDKIGFLIMGSVLDRLLREFFVVHNHPNNDGGLVRKRDIELPRVLEITFHRKDRATPQGHPTEFPHPLDRINDPSRPDIVLPLIWRM